MADPTWLRRATLELELLRTHVAALEALLAEALPTGAAREALVASAVRLASAAAVIDALEAPR